MRKASRGATSSASCVVCVSRSASARSRLGQSSRSRPSRRRVARATPARTRIVAKELSPRTCGFSAIAFTATATRRAMRARGRASSRRSASHRLRSRVARPSRARRVGAVERARHFFFLLTRRRASAPRRVARAARSVDVPRRAFRLGRVARDGTVPRARRGSTAVGQTDGCHAYRGRVAGGTFVLVPA